MTKKDIKWLSKYLGVKVQYPSEIILALAKKIEKLENPPLPQDPQQIEVIHGAPPDEQMANPPTPQIPGQAPIVGTEEAALIPSPKDEQGKEDNEKNK